MAFLKKINKILAKPMIRAIKIYQYTLSPDKGLPSFWLKGRICSHEPHCSQYSIGVFKRYGFWPGIFYATDRVLHCTASMHKTYDPEHYRVVFVSSAPIGVPFLKHLAHDKRFEVIGVVTQCDKPSGRGMEMGENIIKKTANNLNNSKFGILNSEFIKTPTKLNPEKSEEGREFAQRLKEKNPDLLVVIAYGKIIPQAILDIPRVAPINIHGSLLPKYRGASPIQSTLLHNDKETGITIMKMDATMDTGDMIDILRFTIPFNWTTKDLIDEMKKIGPKFLNETLRKYGKKLLGEVKQQENKANYCKKIEKESGLIDPRKDSIETIYNKYRAFYLWPKIYFMLNDKRVIIEELKLSDPLYNSNDELSLFQGKALHPAIIDIQLKPEGKKTMPRKEFLNGYIR
ncbi:MAG: methionyl-tRNA formyltransferase [Candidatus Absconditabacterales bacterium]